jgi:hypothetical protein
MIGVFTLGTLTTFWSAFDEFTRGKCAAMIGMMFPTPGLANADLDVNSDKRQCGDCRVCCILPPINEPELVKACGTPCSNLCAAGCSIQETKPAACRTFLCAWRLIPEIDESWRPDRIGMLGIIGFNQLGGAGDA